LAAGGTDRLSIATRRDAATERVLFALAANRALDPSSKLAAAHWVGRKAYIDQLPATTADACYRAMDWLHQVRDALERQVFSQVATTLNLELDLLFFHTTSIYFEVDTEDSRSRGTRTAVPSPAARAGTRLPGIAETRARPMGRAGRWPDSACSASRRTTVTTRGTQE
jgi:hypothetical protein